MHGLGTHGAQSLAGNLMGPELGWELHEIWGPALGWELMGAQSSAGAGPQVTIRAVGPNLRRLPAFWPQKAPTSVVCRHFAPK